jgi:hypothetical protein
MRRGRWLILNNWGTSGSMSDRRKQWARTVKRDAHALYLAARDSRVVLEFFLEIFGSQSLPE